ncbi:cytochrome c oxidase assembly protein Cox11p, mitochondrial [Trichomonascus vanleenenianus]|uniref:Cox11p n=1 Tax=Trichomonascus vanleenenianus TaxID=2268995 RepID=UPI003ECB53F4
MLLRAILRPRVAQARPFLHTERFFSRTSLQFNQAVKHKMDQARREAFLRGMAQARREKDREYVMSMALYSTSVIIGFLALAYAAVPLYRVMCQRTGYGGQPITDTTKFTPERLVPIDRKRRIKVSFSSETSGILPWRFKPQQREVSVLPGETALAFYKAYNTSDKDIIGMATYSVIPEKAAPYFSKIQCFCFEEQMLRAGEEVDMPVFFFIDPDFAADPAMANVDDIILHYTFFKAQYDNDGVLTPVNQKEAA